MISAPFVAITDADVLYPFTLRDTLLRAAERDLYQLRWSASILDEMERNLVGNGVMAAKSATRLRTTMERVFPDAMVTDFEPLIAGMKNHPKDRHVAAAALKAGAQVIVTSNLKDFADLPEGIEAQSPDEFLCNLCDLDPGTFIELLHNQAADLANPPTTFEDLLQRLARVTPALVELVREKLPSHG